MNLPNVLRIYADLIDGVRSYYARREGDNSAASFSAAMLLSAILALNVVSATIFLDLALYRELRSATWVGAHRGLAALVPTGIAAAHLVFAKVAGVYNRRGSARTASWSGTLRVYVGATILLFVIALMAIGVVTR